MTLENRVKKLEALQDPGTGQCCTCDPLISINWCDDPTPENAPEICPQCGRIRKAIVIRWEDGE